MSQNYVKLIVTNNVIELMEYEKLNVKNKIPDTAYIIEKDKDFIRTKTMHEKCNIEGTMLEGLLR